jgi:hypothetical protein
VWLDLQPDAACRIGLIGRFLHAVKRETADGGDSDRGDAGKHERLHDRFS